MKQPNQKDFPEDWSPPKRKTHSFGSIIGFFLLSILVYGWWNFGSFDAAFKKAYPIFFIKPSAQIVPRGSDWTLIDGIRWVRLIGTDSAGIGYNGWVPELAFRETPPEPTASGTNNLLTQMGLPSPEETMKAYKQLGDMRKQLKKQLNRN